MKKIIWTMLIGCLLLTGCNTSEKVDGKAAQKDNGKAQNADTNVEIEEVRKKGLAIIDVTMNGAYGETSLVNEKEAYTGSETFFTVSTSQTIVGVDFIFSPTGTSGPYNNRPAEIFSLTMDGEGIFTTLPIPGPLHGSGYFIAFNQDGVGIKSNTIYFQPDESHF